MKNGIFESDDFCRLLCCDIFRYKTENEGWMMAKTVINRYIREIKKYLTGRLTKRWAICAELKNILRDTYDDDEYLTIEMLYEEF